MLVGPGAHPGGTLHQLYKTAVHFILTSCISHAQYVMAEMAEQWNVLIVAEGSVLVNIFHCPQALFPPSTKAYREAKQTLVKKYVHIIERCVMIYIFLQHILLIFPAPYLFLSFLPISLSPTLLPSSLHPPFPLSFPFLPPHSLPLSVPTTSLSPFLLFFFLLCSLPLSFPSFLLLRLVTHMESEMFQQDEELSVYILHNFRGMLKCPPELNDSVSYMIVKGIMVWKFLWNQEFMTTTGAQLSTYAVCKIKIMLS